MLNLSCHDTQTTTDPYYGFIIVIDIIIVIIVIVIVLMIFIVSLLLLLWQLKALSLRCSPAVVGVLENGQSGDSPDLGATFLPGAAGGDGHGGGGGRGA